MELNGDFTLIVMAQVEHCVGHSIELLGHYLLNVSFSYHAASNFSPCRNISLSKFKVLTAPAKDSSQNKSKISQYTLVTYNFYSNFENIKTVSSKFFTASMRQSKGECGSE